MSSSGEFPLRCKCRRQAPTSLRCARCSVPICPDCSIVAPFGQICRNCAYGDRGRLYQVEPGTAAAAAGAGLAASVAVSWFLIHLLAGFGLFALWGWYLAGLASGEAALRASGRKRGKPMEVLAVTCCVAGVVIASVLTVRGMAPLPILLLSYFSNPWSYLNLALAGYGSYSRVHHF